MIPQLERRITIPEDVYVALGEIAAKERQKIKDPLFKKMITEKSLAQHILLDEVKRRGCKLMTGWANNDGKNPK